MTKTKGTNDVVLLNGTLHIYSFGKTEIGLARLNQTFNLTNYKYIKAKLKTGEDMGRIGIGTSAGITALASLTKYSDEFKSGIAILDVSSISGNYYIYLICRCTRVASGSGSILICGSIECEELFLANT